MKLDIKTNFPSVAAAMNTAARHVPFATSLAINNAAESARLAVRSDMTRVFDRPTPWVLNSLRVKRSTKANLTAELAYKDRNSAESSRSMIEPHVFGGGRHYGGLEARLRGIRAIPSGWNVVPGAAAKLDAYGNMSKGQVSQLLNVLGAYTEAGYNKADYRTKDRLAKGNAKKNQYGFAYWINPVGKRRATHLPPGVYQRVQTGFGSSLRPVLIFVGKVAYRKRLDFFGTAQRVVDREFPIEFDKSMQHALDTALIKVQDVLL